MFNTVILPTHIFGPCSQGHVNCMIEPSFRSMLLATRVQADLAVRPGNSYQIEIHFAVFKSLNISCIFLFETC